MMHKATLIIVAGLLVSAGGLVPSPAASGATTPTPTVSVDDLDTITFRNGNVVKGVILEETATLVRVRVVSFGIEAVTSYDLADVLSIKKVDRSKVVEHEAASVGAAVEVAEAPREHAAGEAAHRVYRIKLDGRFGREITQTPLRDALEDAAKNHADYVVIEINNEWKRNPLEDLPDDAAAFDQLFRAEAMHPLLNPTRELGQIFAGQDVPTVVFWVKKAMGGATFLPLICPEIYFHEDGKMGGIGNFGNLFGSMGDEVVRDKQESLRMAHAEGVVIRGGYPIEIVHAMADKREVYSYRIVGGRVEFLNDWPDPSQGWHLLTDDGEGENADTIQQLARSKGNDTLTLDAKMAQTLQISRGTVNTFDALIFALGLSRNSMVIEGNSDKIMDRWESGLDSAERRLVRLWREYSEIQVQGATPRERNADRGRQIRKLKDMIKLLKRYEEAISARRLRLPDEPNLRIIIAGIEQQMRLDR